MRAALLFAVLLLSPGAVQASDAPPPKRRPIPVAPAPPPEPPPRATPIPASAGRWGLAGFATLPRADDGGTVCRTACARDRYVCEVQADSCSGQWVACVKGCTGATSANTSALLPR